MGVNSIENMYIFTINKKYRSCFTKRKLVEPMIFHTESTNLKTIKNPDD